jgi:putative flippase GtrA
MGKLSIYSIRWLWSNSELSRFVVVGGTTVIIDLISYSVLLMVGFNSFYAKGLSFSFGATFAYLANLKVTFRRNNYGIRQFILFILLYLLTLGVNVMSNEFILDVFDAKISTFIMAFLVATSISASLNFLGMKFIIFKQIHKTIK